MLGLIDKIGVMDYTIRLPDATELPGQDPVIVIGPNGSGKTRKTRELTAAVPIDFVNALRNTRVNPDIPPMGYDTARNSLTAQHAQARAAHWELASDFDVLLSQLLAQDAMSAIEFRRNIRLGHQTEPLPASTPLAQVEDIWGEVFPGRALLWRDWKPVVRSEVFGSDVEYSGNQMSDGEKAALYLAGRVFSVEPGIIVVDEPETHLHSLLAIRLWNALEKARLDLRFVYVTHDLTFALSRQSPRFILSSPTAGLRVLDLGHGLPSDVAAVLLGSASLSFYASRVMFCEGDDTSIDAKIYGAWFAGRDTVVRSVGNCQMVLRCVEALRASGVANSLEAEGIIDRDFHPLHFLNDLPTGVHALKVHEAESLLCLPDVVKAVAEHLGRDYSAETYRKALASSITDSERHKVIIERWKRQLEPNLAGLVSSISTRLQPLDQIVREIPAIFDHTSWPFSPEKILEEEKNRVESASPITSVEEFLAVIPGKKLIAEAARTVDMMPKGYIELVTKALSGKEKALSKLCSDLQNALESYLPQRTVEVTSVPGQTL